MGGIWGWFFSRHTTPPPPFSGEQRTFSLWVWFFSSGKRAAGASSSMPRGRWCKRGFSWVREGAGRLASAGEGGEEERVVYHHRGGGFVCRQGRGMAAGGLWGGGVLIL